MNGNGWSRGLRVASIAAVAWLFVWGLAAFAGTLGSSTPAPSTPTQSAAAGDVGSADTDVFVPANNADLNKEQFDALVARCGSNLDTAHLALNRAKGDKDDFVLFGPGPAYTTWEDYECVVMTHPTVAHMWVAGWRNEKAASGKTLGKINPWMNQFLKSSKGSLMEAWVLKGESSGALVVSEDYQKTAFNVVTLLNRFTRGDEVTTKAVWHRPADNMQAEGLPKTFKSKKSYKGEFIPLSYTLKGQQCPFVVYGVNVNDGRMAKLKFPCKETPPTSPPTSPPTTKPPTTKPPKNPSEHPANNGNAPSPSVPAPPVTEAPSKPSQTPSATYKPAPQPEPTKSRTTQPTQPAPPKPTATATVDPCAGGSDNPACG